MACGLRRYKYQCYCPVVMALNSLSHSWPLVTSVSAEDKRVVVSSDFRHIRKQVQAHNPRRTIRPPSGRTFEEISKTLAQVPIPVNSWSNPPQHQIWAFLNNTFGLPGRQLLVMELSGCTIKCLLCNSLRTHNASLFP